MSIVALCKEGQDKLDLAAIEARHKQDAAWFSGGLHDPNGYVAMAHKDRGELLERLRQNQPESDVVLCPRCAKLVGDAICGTTSPPPQVIVDPMVAVPKAAWDWLMGAGPDDNGSHFGDSLVAQANPSALYWWRTTFRRMCGL